MTTLTDSGQGYDIAIGGLGFRCAIDKDQPYERATAQFRKEQFDSAASVGDQSLTGWWTRGQLSFHKGAGTKFYEVLEDADLINTYAHSEGVDISTPGRAIPYADLAGVSTQGFSDFCDTTLNRTDICVGVNNSNSPRYVTAAGAGTALTMSAGASSANDCMFHATDGHAYFVTNNGVDRLDSGSDTMVQTWNDGGTADLEPMRCWSAKDRAFIVSADGHWWAVDPNPGGAPGTLDATNSFWDSGLAATDVTTFSLTVGNWTLTESPGAVYAAHTNKIFAFTVDATGVVPTLSAGIVAGQLPVGEVIYEIQYGLGTITLATSEGVRVALIDSNDNLVIGPLSPALNEATSVDVFGNHAIIAGEGSPTGSPTMLIAMVDLTQLISGESVEFAHSYYHRGSSGSIRPKIRALRGGIYAAEENSWNDASSSLLRQIRSTGTPTYTTYSKFLTTGFHRFGTLESKFYHSIRVRLDPSPLTGQVVSVYSGITPSGSIDVYSVTQAGVETLLGSIAASSSGSDFDITTTAEALAFKFVFNGTPFLSGYQIRALPAPQRQRMIRIPLMLQDVERRGGTRAQGYEGSAYDRLAALEAMEESGSVHDYQDFRTGETGSVFIESVEFRGITSPSNGDSGFGGVVWLTCRKV